jgi:hypothetical protein
MVARYESIDDYFCGFFRHDSSATGENISRSIAIFRPGVNGKVRFSDDDDSADSLRAEPVKRLSQYCGAASDSGGNHDVPDGVEVIQKIAVAVIEFYEKMFP